MIHPRLFATFVLIILCTYTAVSQEPFGEKFDKYESEKKELVTGYLLASLFPGAGVLYAGDELAALGILGYSVGMVIWAYNQDNKTGPIVGLVAAKIVEYTMTYSKIRSFNTNLRVGLGLASSTTNLKLSISFAL
jgi:TM2 domain-containing membrane protein YozV